MFVPDQARWGTIQKQATHIGETLNAASAALEEQNRALEGILTSIDYTDESKLGYTRESVLADMIRCCSEVSLRNDRMADPDLLSAAHEDLLEWSPTTRPARRTGEPTQYKSFLKTALEGILTSIDYTDESKLGYTRESVLADMIRCCSEVSLRNDRMADPDLLSAAHEDLLEWSPTTRPARRPGSSTRRGGRL